MSDISVGLHEKTHHHIKRAQLLIILAIAINLVVFIYMYTMLTWQMSSLKDRVGLVSTDLQNLDQRTELYIRGLEGNMSEVSSGLGNTTERLGLMNTLLAQLSDELENLGEESRTGIAGLRSELNYTGTINKALESVVLIIAPDKSSVVGSGFIVSEDGYVLTAKHVVDAFEGKTVRVKTKEGDIYIASVVDKDSNRDVAVLKISATGLLPLEFGDSEALSPGSKVFALGAPEGFSFSAAEGIVSAVRTVSEIKAEVGLDLNLASGVHVVQTDAAITHGNSGGPLIDNGGKVVGLNSFGISKGSSSQEIAGLNFAIASNDVEEAYGDATETL